MNLNQEQSKGKGNESKNEITTRGYEILARNLN